jgi:hypothetical protein
VVKIGAQNCSFTSRAVITISVKTWRKTNSPNIVAAMLKIESIHNPVNASPAGLHGVKKVMLIRQ